MKNYYLVLISTTLVLALSGCGAKENQTSISIIEHGAKGGFPMVGDAVVGGCSILKTGDLKGLTLYYRSERCSLDYRFPVSGDEPEPTMMSKPPYKFKVK